LVQFSEEDYFLKNSFTVQNSIKLYKDLTFNRTIIENLNEENSKYKDGNYRLLGNIINEKGKYFFVPLLIELGNDRENTNDVAWLIYNTKANPEINQSYILKEGDIIKMGNAIFQIKMIQISENDEEANGKINELESNNNTLIISGSANQSLILNKNYANENLNITAKKINVKNNKNIRIEKKYNSMKVPESNEFQKLPNEKDIISKKTTNKICRICYQEEDDILLNPLIRPCKCSGSMRYIHLKCLLHWLKSRTSNSQIINHSNENFNAYFLNQRTECELCKQLFPDYIKHNNIKYCLIDFDYAQENKIKGSNNNAQNYVNTNMDNNINQNSNKNKEEKNNFIILDTIFPLTDNNKYRYIVKFDENNEMRIGRGLDNQLVLNEITVSRSHCLLKLEKNKYGKFEIKMQDESSKFGTLILVQSNKVEIIKGKPLHIQISNIHFIIQYKKNIKLSCCNVSEVDDKNSYEKFNGRAVKTKNVINVLSEINSDDENNNINKDDKNKDSKEIKINKNKEPNNIVLSLNKNNDSNNEQNNNENMKTIPKENSEKKEDNLKNENKEELKDSDKNGKNNNSIEVEDDNDKKDS
jgi:pSer/pThr/pTyr-binding forkhead associated (FHA) protein